MSDTKTPLPFDNHDFAPEYGVIHSTPSPLAAHLYQSLRTRYLARHHTWVASDPAFTAVVMPGFERVEFEEYELYLLASLQEITKLKIAATLDNLMPGAQFSCLTLLQEGTLVATVVKKHTSLKGSLEVDIDKVFRDERMDEMETRYRRRTETLLVTNVIAATFCALWVTFFILFMNAQMSVGQANAQTRQFPLSFVAALQSLPVGTLEECQTSMTLLTSQTVRNAILQVEKDIQYQTDRMSPASSNLLELQKQKEDLERVARDQKDRDLFDEMLAKIRVDVMHPRTGPEEAADTAFSRVAVKMISDHQAAQVSIRDGENDE